MVESGLWPTLTRADKILAFVVAISVLGLTLQGRQNAAGGVLLVEVAGADSVTHMLSDYRLLRVDGVLGECQIEVGPRGARVLVASCAHKICMRRGWIRQRGDLAVCVPNGLVLRIAGTARVDAVVR